MTESTEIKIARIEANHDNLVRVINKLDGTMTKLTEVSTDIAQMLAVHESRLEQQHNLIREIHKETREELTKVDRQIGDLHDKIGATREDIRGEIDQGFKSLSSKFEDVKKINKDYRDGMDKKYERIQKFIWMIAGGGVVAGFIISKGISLLYEFLKTI